jgi:peptide/nickel transport system permease protein
MAFLISLFTWPGPTRVIRSQILTLRERGYVRMALLSGVPPIKIILFEMLPNMMPLLMASLTLIISDAILTAASLEALGLGPGTPTLGTTIYNAINSAAIIRGMWWWWGPPIVLLVLIFVSLFLMTVGLDEIANPRLRGATKQ